MASENDLCELGGLIEDATDLVERAITLALRLTGDDPTDTDGWPAISRLIEQLEAASKILNALPGDEVDNVIKTANKYLDDMADRADGISY